jgi:hypothetical protein
VHNDEKGSSSLCMIAQTSINGGDTKIHQRPHLRPPCVQSATNLQHYAIRSHAIASPYVKVMFKIRSIRRSFPIFPFRSVPRLFAVLTVEKLKSSSAMLPYPEREQIGGTREFDF